MTHFLNPYPNQNFNNGKKIFNRYSHFAYVLVYRNHKLAALEAKKRDAYPTEGLGQAKDYAERLKTRFALCTNGDKIYQVDMLTGKEEYIDRYPTPDELWAATYPKQNDWRDRFAAIPFEDKGGTWEARYYQHNAIEAVLVGHQV